MVSFLYLHGFASSPKSRKAGVFRDRFAGIGIDLIVPDLNTGGLESLTLTRQLSIVQACAGHGPVALIGSSLGGYLAALYAARHRQVQKLVLLAPAFGFARLYAASLGPEPVEKWKASGKLTITDYSTGAPAEVGWQLMEDALLYEEEPAITQPCLIIHGLHDDIVPIAVSRAFARTRTCAELLEVDSDHELSDVAELAWEHARRFLLE